MEKFIVLLPLLASVSDAIIPQGGTPRLVHSNTTEPGEVTYYASIYYETKYGKDIICGATIISNFDVLTSASCLKELGDKLDISKITVVAGDYRRNIVDVGMEQSRLVEKITIHEHFIPEKGENDLAVISTVQKFVFGFYVSMLRLPEHPRTVPSGYGDIVGFGSITGSGMEPLILRKIRVLGHYPKECAEMLPDETITSYIMCVGGEETPQPEGYPCGIEDVGAGFKSDCSPNEYDDDYVCGIRIGTATCESDQTIIRYTVIAKYYQWIRENMKV